MVAWLQLPSGSQAAERVLCCSERAGGTILGRRSFQGFELLPAALMIHLERN